MVDGELAAYRRLAGAVNGNAAAAAALAELEAPFFNSLMLALDRFFVHRIRPVTGKDGNPLNEVELLAEGLIRHGGVLRESRVLKLVPEDSVSQIGYGERIELTADGFERVAGAFFSELRARFVQTA